MSGRQGDVLRTDGLVGQQGCAWDMAGGKFLCRAHIQDYIVFLRLHDVYGFFRGDLPVAGGLGRKVGAQPVSTSASASSTGMAIFSKFKFLLAI